MPRSLVFVKTAAQPPQSEPLILGFSGIVSVLPEPLGDNHTGLVDACKPLSIHNLAPERPIEGPDEAVLPGRARIDPDGFNADALKPVLERCRGELARISAG